MIWAANIWWCWQPNFEAETLIRKYSEISLWNSWINFNQGIQNVSDNVRGGNGLMISRSWYLGSKNRKQLISRVGVILSHWFRNWTLSSIRYSLLHSLLVLSCSLHRATFFNVILKKMTKISFSQVFFIKMKLYICNIATRKKSNITQKYYAFHRRNKSRCVFFVLLLLL